jgi:glycosyltransferase involved in cell wall biosynthesis
MHVTVGLPFFNARHTLGAAIASVLNQTFEDWELILVDDGSTDGSRQVAKEALADPRVRLLWDGKNQGLVARLNQIAAAARAPLLARMDADDVMHPDRLQLQTMLISRTGADLVGAGAWVMDERQRITGVRRPAPFRTRADVLRGGGFVHPSCLGRTRWFLLHPYDRAFVRAEDLELWARTVEQSRFAFLEQPLLFYREPRRPNLAAYRASWQTERRIVRRYGPGVLSAPEVAARAALTHVKALAYRLASPFPAATGALIARRSAPVSEAERTAAEAVLARATARPAGARA